MCNGVSVGTPDFVVAAVVIRDDDGRILLVRKRGTHRFMLPGGKIEAGESPDQTAVREAREELGVVLDVTRLALLGDWTAPAANEDGRTVHGHIYVHPWVRGVAACNEIDEVLWLSPGEAEQRADLAPLFQHHVLPVLSQR